MHLQHVDGIGMRHGMGVAIMVCPSYVREVFVRCSSGCSWWVRWVCGCLWRVREVSVGCGGVRGVFLRYSRGVREVFEGCGGVCGVFVRCS